MAKALIVVESPAKAKTINKYLGRDYKVIASMGHVRDLPKSKLGVDVEAGFEPEYVVIPTRAKVIKELKEAAKAAAGDVYAWLKGKLTGRAAEALSDLEKDPASEDNRGDLRKQLAKALEADPALLAELRRLLPEGAGAGATTQTIDQSRSTNAKAAQVRGKGNVTSIG